VATKAEVTAILTERTGAMLALVRTLTGSQDSPSPDQAIAWAVRRLGGSTASFVDATSGEVVAIAQDEALIDLAELRLLNSMYVNLTATTNQTGPLRDDYNDLARRLETARREKRAEILAVHGVNVGAGETVLRRTGIVSL
jgi:hypothetical protein